MKRKETKMVVVHCSASHKDYTMEQLDSDHRKRGFIKGGYHVFVAPDGKVNYYLGDTADLGRQIDEVGAHAKGFNSVSIGVVWIGGYMGINDFSEDQYKSLLHVCKGLIEKYPEIGIDGVVGHTELPGVIKACPVIDMDKFRYQLRYLIQGTIAKDEDPPMIGEPREFVFEDVESDRWSREAIEWASQDAKLFFGREVIKRGGEAGFHFDPENFVTREEAAVVFHRFFRYIRGL